MADIVLALNPPVKLVAPVTVPPVNVVVNPVIVDIFPVELPIIPVKVIVPAEYVPPVTAVVI